MKIHYYLRFSASSAGDSCIESADQFGSVIDLVLRQFRVDREGQHFLRGALGGGKVAGLMAEVGVGFLEMKGQRVEHLRIDAVLLEERLERFAARLADGE